MKIIPAKIDFKKTQKELYQPSSKEVVMIKVPEMQFLMIDGMGSPGDSQEYQNALAALYPVAFKTKFLSKGKGKDYVVPPLEGLWWADDMNDFRSGNRDKWKWTMMIRQPDWITEKFIEEAIEITKKINRNFLNYLINYVLKDIMRVSVLKLCILVLFQKKDLQ